MASSIFNAGGGAGIGSYVLVFKNGVLDPKTDFARLRGAYDSGDSIYLSLIGEGYDEALVPASGWVDEDDKLHLVARDFDDGKTYTIDLAINAHEAEVEIKDGIEIDGTRIAEGASVPEPEAADRGRFLKVSDQGEFEYAEAGGGGNEPILCDFHTNENATFQDLFNLLGITQESSASGQQFYINLIYAKYGSTTFLGTLDVRWGGGYSISLSSNPGTSMKKFTTWISDPSTLLLTAIYDGQIDYMMVSPKGHNGEWLRSNGSSVQFSPLPNSVANRKSVFLTQNDTYDDLLAKLVDDPSSSSSYDGYVSVYFNSGHGNMPISVGYLSMHTYDDGQTYNIDYTTEVSPEGCEVYDGNSLAHDGNALTFFNTTSYIIQDKELVPATTTQDAGKVLTVLNDGNTSWEAPSGSSGELPVITTFSQVNTVGDTLTELGIENFDTAQFYQAVISNDRGMITGGPCFVVINITTGPATIIFHFIADNGGAYITIQDSYENVAAMSWNAASSQKVKYLSIQKPAAADEGKVLTVTDAYGSFGWQTASGGNELPSFAKTSKGENCATGKLDAVLSESEDWRSQSPSSLMALFPNLTNPATATSDYVWWHVGIIGDNGETSDVLTFQFDLESYYIEVHPCASYEGGNGILVKDFYYVEPDATTGKFDLETTFEYYIHEESDAGVNCVAGFNRNSSNGDYYLTMTKQGNSISQAWTQKAEPQIYTEITHSQLLTKMQTGELVKGMMYRITDYDCTTTQTDTSSAHHVFDIIVRAISENQLDENARAALHVGDTYFSAALHKTNISAWELKYRVGPLSSDDPRYSWADTSSNGKGIIYWMRDEFGNEAPYDFKNVLFDGKYTFDFLSGGVHYDLTVYHPSVLEVIKCKNNKIEPYMVSEQSEGSTRQVQKLNNIVLRTTTTTAQENNVFLEGCHDIDIQNNCIGVNFGNDCHDVVAAGAWNLRLGNDCHDITFSTTNRNIEIKDACNNITFTSDYVRNVTIEQGLSYFNIGSQSTGSLSSYLQNLVIHMGDSGTDSSPIDLTSLSRDVAYEMSYGRIQDIGA